MRNSRRTINITFPKTPITPPNVDASEPSVSDEVDDVLGSIVNAVVTVMVADTVRRIVLKIFRVG